MHEIDTIEGEMILEKSNFEEWKSTIFEPQEAM
jgi:hypothetical protein